MKVVAQTRDRLELVHRPMVFMALAGVAGAAYGVWLWLGAEDWKGYVGAGISVVVGLVLVLTATNSRVVFDRGAGWYDARHRRLLGRTKMHREWLSSVEAVAVNRDATLGNVMVVNCIRVGGRDLPIAMFGTPFPAAAYHQGLRIARFLGVPLAEKDRIVVEDPQDQVAGLLTTVVAGPEKEGTVRAKWNEARKWGYFVWAFDLAMLAFYAYLVLDRDTTAPVLGLEPTLWKMVLLVFGLFFLNALGLSARLCERYTGITYVKDRKAFALAGGFDVGQWPMLATQVALYGVYWFTFTRVDPDPIARFRHWWVYLLASLVVGFVLSRIAARIAFPLWARRHLGRTRPEREAEGRRGGGFRTADGPAGEPLSATRRSTAPRDVASPPFESAAQEDVYRRVGGWLRGVLGDSVAATGEGPLFVVRFRGTAVVVTVVPWGDDDATISVRSYVGQGSAGDGGLMRDLLRENDRLRLGAWGMDERGAIFLEHSVAGSTCTEEKLRVSLTAVMAAADAARERILGRSRG